MNAVYLILIIATAGAPIERAYEFQTEGACQEAAAQVDRAYKGRKDRPLVFCSPTPTPVNGGRVLEIAPAKRPQGGTT